MAGQLLYGAFETVEELGRGGQARVLAVRGVRSSEAYRVFLAEAAAWQEVNNHHQIVPLRLEVARRNRDLQTLHEQEADAMDRGEEAVAAEVRGQIETLMVELNSQVEELKTRQQQYVDRRGGILVQASVEAMIQHLEKLGLPHPADDMFALKQILDDDPCARQRLQDEFKSLKLVQPPNIQAAYVMGTDYYVTEYIRGIVPPERIIAAPDGRASLYTNADRIRIILDAAHAVEHTHVFGVIHRDLKPDNIAVSSTGKVTLIDFGLVKSVETEAQTQTGIAMGTPHFMCREQIEIEGLVSPTIDIYALGAALYNYLTGVKPYEQARNTRTGVIKTTQSYQDVFNTICTDAYALIPPSQIMHGIPRVLEDIIMKAMARESRNRYQTVTEFRTDLERYLSLAGQKVRNSTGFHGVKAEDLKMRVRRRERGPAPAPREGGAGEGRRARDTDAVKKRRLLVIAAAGVALLVLILALVIGLAGGDPAAQEAAAAAAQNQEQVRAAMAMAEGKFKFAEESFAALPQDYAAAVANFNTVVRDGRGTPFETRAQERVREITRLWLAERERVPAALDAQAKACTDRQDWQGALGVYENYRGPLADELPSLRAEAVRDLKRRAAGAAPAVRVPSPAAPAAVPAAPRAAGAAVSLLDKSLFKPHGTALYALEGGVLRLTAKAYLDGGSSYPVGIRFPAATGTISYETRFVTDKFALLYVKGVQYGGGDRSMKVRWENDGTLGVGAPQGTPTQVHEDRDKRQSGCDWQSVVFEYSTGRVAIRWNGIEIYAGPLPSNTADLFGFELTGTPGSSWMEVRNAVFTPPGGAPVAPAGPAPAVLPSVASGEGWVDLITAVNAKGRTWWDHPEDVKNGFNKFVVADGVVKVDQAETAFVFRDLILGRDIDLALTFDMAAEYLGVSLNTGKARMDLGVTRSFSGKHTMRIEVRAGKLRLWFDDREIGLVDKCLAWNAQVPDLDGELQIS